MRPSEPDLTSATWFKSSYSGNNGGECVEVSFLPGGVGVRESKQLGRGPVLLFARGEWAAFLAAARAGEFAMRDPAEA